MSGSQEEPSSYSGFPVAPIVHLIHSNCLLSLISLIQEQTVAMLQGNQAGKNLIVKDHFIAEAECTLSTCATDFIDPVATAFA